MQPTQEEQDAPSEAPPTQVSPVQEPSAESLAESSEPSAELSETKQPFAEAAQPTLASESPLSDVAPSESGSPSRRGYPPVADAERPTYVFLGVVAALSLFADISTKVWAEITLNDRGQDPISVIGDNVSIILAYNKGGAWGLGSQAGEMFRKPFFLGVSAFAIVFILSLYSRLHPQQKALKWGLPLVLGGALGNLSDRITRSQVIDFIDYRADWVMSLNSFIHRYSKSWALTDHWPTFNIADVAICIGVILMGVDMFTHRHRPGHHPAAPSGPAESTSERATLEPPSQSAPVIAP